MENCVSDGLYCAYTPKFLDSYKVTNPNFELTGREVLVQALYEKCLHKLMSDKYKDEGTLFWTYFSYLDVCFVEDAIPVDTLDECFDWSTVLIDGNEEVETIEECVDSSFEVFGDYSTPNSILQSDRDWAQHKQMVFHPSIVVNNIVYKGDISG